MIPILVTTLVFVMLTFATTRLLLLHNRPIYALIMTVTNVAICGVILQVLQDPRVVGQFFRYLEMILWGIQFKLEH